MVATALLLLLCFAVAARVDAAGPTPTPAAGDLSSPSQSSTSPAQAADSGGFGADDAMGYGVFFAFVGFAGWLVWWFWQKAQRAVGGGGVFDSIEEASFERELIKTVLPAPPGAAPPESAPAPVQASAGAAPPAAPFRFAPPAAVPPLTPASPSASMPAEVAAVVGVAAGAGADLGRRMQALGVFDVIEGSVPLPVPPDGVIWRLKAGGSALVLPRLEAESTMAHFARRFDFVIAPVAGGETLVVRRLEGQLGDWTKL